MAAVFLAPLVGLAGRGDSSPPASPLQFPLPLALNTSNIDFFILFSLVDGEECVPSNPPSLGVVLLRGGESICTDGSGLVPTRTSGLGFLPGIDISFSTAFFISSILFWLVVSLSIYSLYSSGFLRQPGNFKSKSVARLGLTSPMSTV